MLLVNTVKIPCMHGGLSVLPCIGLRLQNTRLS